MKRIASLALAAILGLGCTSAASAVEVKVKGNFDFAFGLQENAAAGRNESRGEAFYKEDGADNFAARQRFQSQIDIIASETLRAVLFFRIGDTDWGRSTTNNTGVGAGGALGAKGVNIRTRRAYIDWYVPNVPLNFRVGIQNLALPGAMAGSPIIDDDVAAFVGSYKFNDNFALTAFWARLWDHSENDGWDQQKNDETDLFGLIAPITLDGFKITPWGVYGNVGQGSGDSVTNIGGIYLSGRNRLKDRVRGNSSFVTPATPTTAAFTTINPGLEYLRNGGADRFNSQISPRDSDGGNVWWAGSAFEMSILDPLTFKADIMYGSMTLDDAWLTREVNQTTGVLSNPSRKDYRSSGWFFDAAVNYKTSWGTPGIFGWYSTGDNLGDVENGKFGRMPTTPGTSPNFKPGSFGFDGSQNDVMTDSIVTRTGIGFWGIGGQIKDMSFIQDLSHTLRVMYYGGTNSQNIINKYMGRVSPFGFAPNDLYLGTSEGALEVNFDHSYKIYENLLLQVDLGYIHLNLSKGRNGTANNTSSGPDEGFKSNWASTQDAWKAQFGFRYNY